MPANRRAPQAFEQTDLDLLRPQSHEPVETGRERGQVLSGQTDDQVGVQVRGGFRPQAADISLNFVIVLPALLATTSLTA